MHGSRVVNCLWYFYLSSTFSYSSPSLCIFNHGPWDVPHPLLIVKLSHHVLVTTYMCTFLRWEMTLNYRVKVERHPFPNGVVGGSMPPVIFSLYLTEKTNQVGRKPRADHRKVGSKPHPAPRWYLSRVEPTGSNSRWIARRWLIIYAFMHRLVFEHWNAQLQQSKEWPILSTSLASIILSPHKRQPSLIRLAPFYKSWVLLEFIHAWRCSNVVVLAATLAKYVTLPRNQMLHPL